VTSGLSDEDLEELRLAQRTLERITAIPEDQWAALPDDRVKAFNDELTKCGVLVTRFRETHGRLPGRPFGSPSGPRRQNSSNPSAVGFLDPSLWRRVVVLVARLRPKCCLSW
jgi:hypothetical protein